MTLSPNTFTGEYQYSLDSKGRINIPAKFRQSLSKNNQNTFVTTRGQDPCIWIYPLTEWKKIEECVPMEDTDMDTDERYLNYEDPDWTKDDIEWRKNEDGTDINEKRD